MDIGGGFYMRILALFGKLLEIRRFLLWRVYRSLPYFADDDLLWAYEAAADDVFAAQLTPCCPGVGADVASGREQVLEEQLPLPPSAHRDACVNAWPRFCICASRLLSVTFASLVQLSIKDARLLAVMVILVLCVSMG